MSKDTKRNIIMSIGIVLISVIGFTLAYFTTSMTGTSGIVNFNTGKVGKITFDGGADFTTAEDIEVLPWSESKIFTITVAPSTVSQTVYVYMDYTNTIPELTCNVKDVTANTTSNIVLTTTGTSKTDLGTATTVKLVEKKIEPSNSIQTFTYTLTMGIPETGENQKANLNQIFNGTLYANVGVKNNLYYYNNASPNGTNSKPNAE